MIAVHPYGAALAQDFCDLLVACMDHYDLPSVPKVHLDDMLVELEGPRGVQAALAYADGQPVGFATWVRLFPAGQGFAFYLKEVFVTSGARNKGVGRRLLRHVALVAKEQGVRRVEWSSGVADAIRLYDRLGAPRVDKAFYRLPAASFDDFAREDGT